MVGYKRMGIRENKMVMAAKTVTDSDRLCGTLVALLIVMLP